MKLHVNLCQTNKFDDPKELCSHLTGKAQASTPCSTNYVLLLYFEQLYPEQMLKTRTYKSKSDETQKTTCQNKL